MGCILVVFYEEVIDGAVFPHEAKHKKILVVAYYYGILRISLRTVMVFFEYLILFLVGLRA